MEGAEPSRYVAQLRAEFDGCDAAATGLLDREALTELGRRLHLEARLPPLLDALLGARPHGQVNFEEFKDGLVAVLSLDGGASDDDSSYLEQGETGTHQLPGHMVTADPAPPAVPQEVQPKLIRGAKRYGRRSRPEARSAAGPANVPEDPAPSGTEGAEPSSPGVRRAKLRRSTSLESVESLKSDEEAGSSRSSQTLFHNKAEQRRGAVVPPGGRSHPDLQDGDGDPLWSPAPTLSSTPIRSADLQRAPHWNLLQDDGPVRSAPASLLAAAVGPRVLTRLDDGSGCASPERVAALWTEEGIQNSHQILQALELPLEERLSLAELTQVLDGELLGSANGVHQAALISYKDELQHLQEEAEQARRERDKLRADLDRADQQNLQLVREVDDRHASMEALNESRIRELEADFRERVAATRRRAEQEAEALLQQGERERRALQEELLLLRAREAELQDQLGGATQENQRLQEELSALQTKLREADGCVKKLQRDLDQLLQHKFGGLDPAGAGPAQEDRFCRLLRDYELRCRELQDRNDELRAELELLRSRKSSRPAGGGASELSWRQQRPDSEELEMKGSSSSSGRRLQPADGTAPPPAPPISIQTELALQQLKENHQQELQTLQIQLETQVNYYERQLDMMRQNMEVERKDISQAFKLEISELEEQKEQVEQQAKHLKEAVERLQRQQGGDVERRVQRERAELEQNYAREIGNLVRRLSADKEQLEAELKLRMDQEVMRVRTQLEEVRSENAALQERLKVLQQEVQNLEDEAERRRRRLLELEEQHQRSREEEERLHRENSRYREEVLDLSSRNLQLSSDNADLGNRLHGDKEAVRLLRERLATVSREREEEAGAVEAELGGLRAELQRAEGQKETLRREEEGRSHQVEQLQQRLVSLQAEAELLRSQLLGHAQEGAELRGKLQEAQRKAQEEEEVRLKLQEEATRLRLQNQELQTQLTELQVQNAAVQNLRSRLEEAESARSRSHAQDQALRSDAALSLAKAQQQRGRGLQLEAELHEQRGRGQQLEAELHEQRGRSQKLEAELQLQVQHSRSQLSLKQEQFDTAAAALQQRAEQQEAQLAALRCVLQEKLQELKEQMERGVRLSAALAELHLQNSQLMAALQVTERRQKEAERRSFQLQEKAGALSQLLREAVAAALAT